MKLTLVGLPLGNIEDISYRAIKTLDQAKLVFCEDTRVFHKLWQKLINLNLINHKFTGEFFTLNEFNEKTKLDSALLALQRLGEGILVSDAGLPTISDPGFNFINHIINQQGQIEIIPGPSAAMNSLAVSGFSADRVLFLGFLPKKTSKRQKQFQLINQLETGLSAIFYESPYRLHKTIIELQSHFPPQTPIVVVRELTKPHQEIIRSTLSQISTQLPSKIKGEITFLLRL